MSSEEFGGFGVATDTDALVATVREALKWRYHSGTKHDIEAHAALDALASELERVKAERDAEADRALDLARLSEEQLARLDKALAALLRIKEEAAASWIADLAADVLAEIEGEA